MTQSLQSKPSTLRIACLQVGAFGAPPAECAPAVCARMAAARGSDLVMLPELWPMGFFAFDQYRALAIEVNDEFLAPFARVARELGAYLHLGSVVERDGDRYFNTSLLLDRAGRLVAKYRKIHLFGYQSLEAATLLPGSRVVVVDTPWGRTGLATCYDLRFPELFRAMVDEGASIFLVTSAWPESRLEAWRLLNRTRALENLAVVVATNGCGFTGGTMLAGHSLVVGPTGVPLGEAGAAEETLIVEVNLAQTEETRRTFPALRDRAEFLNPNQTGNRESYA